jgi:hypothetical protein
MKPTPIFIKQAVAAAIVAEPSTTYDALAIRFGISSWMVKKIAKDAGISRPRGIGSPSWKHIGAIRPGHKPKAVCRG